MINTVFIYASGRFNFNERRRIHKKNVGDILLYIVKRHFYIKYRV